MIGLRTFIHHFKKQLNWDERKFGRKRPFRPEDGRLVIQVGYGGLGDHLFYSPLPRVAKMLGKYKKVYLSNFSDFRNESYKRLIWDLNPYIDGYVDEPGYFPEFFYIPSTMNLIDWNLLKFGLDDGTRWHEPDLYYKPKFLDELRGKTVFDPNFVSYVGDLSSEKISHFFSENHFLPDFQLKLRERNYGLNSVTNFLVTSSLENYCDVIYTAEKFYCLTSGSATLAAAIRKPSVAFYGAGQKNVFHHSKLHEYVLLK